MTGSQEPSAAVPAPGADSVYERSLALLLHDALRFTSGPLTDHQRDDLLRGLRAIALGDVTPQFERALFTSMLAHNWVTVAPFRGAAS